MKSKKIIICILLFLFVNVCGCATVENDKSDKLNDLKIPVHGIMAMPPPHSPRIMETPLLPPMGLQIKPSIRIPPHLSQVMGTPPPPTMPPTRVEMPPPYSPQIMGTPPPPTR